MVYNRILYLVLLGFLMSCSVFKKAEKKFEKGEYEVAKDLYQKSIAKQKEEGKSYFKIAESYRLSNRLELAKPYYEEAMKYGFDDDPVYYYYALSLKANRQYDEARRLLEDYLIEKAEDEEFKTLANIQYENLNLIQKILRDSSFYTVKNLKILNTPYDEYGPFYHDGYLYFTSNRLTDRVYKATGMGFTDIYKAQTRGANVDTTSIRLLPSSINWSNTNEGSVAISPNGRTMVFAKGNTGKRKGLNDVNLYITQYRNNTWSEPRLMNINNPNAWNSNPSFSADGRTLYFASNRKGGYGGIDIYSATVNGRGIWGNIRNLGGIINTPEDEMFPSTSQDGKLYFSSNGHPGIGKLDLFVAERRAGKVTVEHLGSPMNSNQDDFGLYLYAPDRGFFSSNRAMGEGGDDIYTFKNEDPNLKIVNYFLAGKTTTHNQNDEEVPLPCVFVRLYSADSVLMAETRTDQDASFNFRVNEEESYLIIADRENYFTTRKSFSTVGKSLDRTKLTELVTNKTFETNILLEEIVLDKAFELENIYYDFDSANIRADAAKELDRLVNILVDNPPISIELSSHTDARGDAVYNQDLSKRRAESAVAYIIKQGIDPSRITARGYGESQLIIKDAQTEEEHETNRRTEFKVTKYDKEIAKRIREQEEAEFKKFNTKETELIINNEKTESATDDEFDFN